MTGVDGDPPDGAMMGPGKGSGKTPRGFLTQFLKLSCQGAHHAAETGPAPCRQPLPAPAEPRVHPPVGPARGRLGRRRRCDDRRPGPREPRAEVQPGSGRQLSMDPPGRALVALLLKMTALTFSASGKMKKPDSTCLEPHRCTATFSGIM